MYTYVLRFSTENKTAHAFSKKESRERDRRSASVQEDGISITDENSLTMDFTTSHLGYLNSLRSLN